MRKEPDFRLFSYFVMILGVMLSFAAAVVPHYDTGYVLLLGIAFAGLLPYVVYGFFSDLVRGWRLLITGVLIFGVDLGVKIPERFLHYDGYASGVIYYAPFISTLAAIVLLGIGARMERRWRGKAIASKNSN
jgi:predicted tellurium resistance membrane protein TerC